MAAVAVLVPGGSPAKAQLAAWTVAKDPDGGVTVTVNQMIDPEGLQATLRADGIPARVTFDPVQAINQPLPAGCTAPKMADGATAEVLKKILTPPAIWTWMQQRQKQQQLHPPTLHVTYRVHGHVEHTTLLGTPGWFAKLQKFLEEHHADGTALANGSAHGSPQKPAQQRLNDLRKPPPVQISGLDGSQMPSSLQMISEKEEQDSVGRSALYINPTAIPAGIGLSIGVDVTSKAITSYASFGFGEDLVATSPQCTGS